MSTESPAHFDAAREVPDEYDFFCEACAYSLAGLTGDRCPECGAPFDPKELPFARVPWLHRRRLGKIKAYLRTVVMVCFRPGRFARELCRPVRISATDARSFRLTTIRLLTRLLALALAAGWTTGLILSYRARRGPLPPVIVLIIVFYALGCLTAIAAFHLFLRLATDMPLFIWKGLPSMQPTELSPVHEYACAPLVWIPITMPIAGYLFYVGEMSMLSARVHFQLLALAAGLIAPVWLWLVALVLMQVSTRPGTRRLTLLAFYLPLHWLMMFFLTFMLWCVFLELELFVAGLLHLTNSFR